MARKGVLKRISTHPGAILREDVLPALGGSVAAFSAQLGIPEPQLVEILAETAPVTPAIADKLAAVLGNDADFWNRLQRQHDLSAPAP